MSRDELDVERDALIGQIKDAFRGVSRDGGVSWREASVIDDYGSDDERDAARALDTEKTWMELLGPGAWEWRPGSQLSFLDPIGFRYYLAPAMILCAEGTLDINIQFHLQRPPTAWEGLVRDSWSLFNRKQTLAIGRFLRFMIRVDKLRWADAALELDELDDPMGWREAYEGYWKAECEGRNKK
jgi:hypothetical protein